MALSAYENFAASDSLDAWTQRYNARTYARQTEVSGAEEGTTLLVTRPAGNARSAFTWNIFDSDADRVDFEIVLRWRSGNFGTGNSFGPAGRIAGSTGSETVYYTQHRPPSVGTVISAYNGGTNIPTIADDTSFSYATNTWYCTRFRVNGNVLRAKVWAGNKGDEPDTPSTGWQIDTTNSTITGAGLLGIFMFVGGSGVNFEVDWIGIATGGDSAPTEPVGGGVEVDAETASLVVQGLPASILTATQVDAQAAQLAMTAYPATVSRDTDIASAVASLTIQGQPAQVQADTAIAANVAELVLTAYQASLAQETAIEAELAELVITGQTASISADVNIEAGTAQLVITGQQGQVVTGSTVFATTALLELAAQKAEILKATVVEAQAAGLVIAGLPAAFSQRTEINANTAALVIGPYPATVERALTIQTQAGQLVISSLRAVVQTGELLLTVEVILAPREESRFTAPRVLDTVKPERVTGTFTVPQPADKFRVH